MATTQHKMSPSETTRLVDLASSRIGASVVAANDEGSPERANFINPEPARFPPNGDLSAHGRPVTDPTALPDTVHALLTGGAS